MSARVLRTAAGRVLRLAALLVAVSAVTFALVAASPVDPVQANVGQAAYAHMGPEKRAQLEAYWGSDTPLPERYLAWASSALHGDFGESLRYNEPVVDVVAQRAGNTIMLMALSWVLSGCIGFALGVLAGACRGRLPDRLVRGYCYVLSATPAFWLGLVALMVFSVWLGWFPLGFSAPVGVDAAAVPLAERLRHVVLPALVLSLTGVANVALHTRQKLIEVLESDYVRFAAARGESRARICVRHGLRNLALPAISLQFAQVSEIFGGSVLVEQVFSYPGLGQAAVTAGIGGDAPLLVGIALASAALVFAGNAVADVLYGIVDPRLRPRPDARRFGGETAAPAVLSGCDDAAPARGGIGAGRADAGEEWAASAAIAPVGEGASAPAGVDVHAPHGGANAVSRSADGRTPQMADAYADEEAGASPLSGEGARPCPSPSAACVTSDVHAVPVLHEPRVRRGGNRRRMLLGLALAASLLAIVVVAGRMASPAAQAADFSLRNIAPCLAHPFGTDWMGRDMLLRTLAGLSTSLLVGLLAAGVSALIACVLASVAAFGGRAADAAVSWLIDLVLGVPHIVLLLLISYALGKGFWGVTVGVALTHWPSLTRLLRAELLQLRAQPFLAQSAALGVSRVRLVLTHVLPAILPQFIVGVVLTFPHAILHEASITFLGFGLSPDEPAIGVILSESMSYLSAGMWWLALLPGAALVACVLAFDRLGDTARRMAGARTVQE